MSEELDTEVTPEVLEKGLDGVKEDIFANRGKIEAQIDAMSKRGLKRLLRVYSGFAFANQLLGNPPLKLQDDENNLLRLAMKLQEDCLGYSKLTEELKGEVK